MTCFNFSPIVSLEEALAICNIWKAADHTVVFTNGCFDILHAGHVSYLNDAKALGSKLVVAVNSDASVQALKGPTRPIVPCDYRKILLSSLRCVDLVLDFQEDTPNAVIETLQPNIHCKGGDYIAEKLPEYPLVKSYGGSVVILPFVDGLSTSAIIKKINSK